MVEASRIENIPLEAFWDERNTKPGNEQETFGGENEVEGINDSEEKNDFVPKLYTRRWLILAGYCLLAMSNLSAWFAFSSISNIIRKYYKINLVTVNWLAMTFSILPLLLMFPSNKLLERKGLGFTIVVASFFNAAGCCVRYIGYSTSNGYNFLLIGSILCAVSTSSYFLPSKIAAVWFGEKEKATATSIAVSFGLAGISLGYFLPTSMVKNRPTVAGIGRDLGNYLLATAVQACLTFILIVMTVKDSPKTPPTYHELFKYKMTEKAKKESLTRKRIKTVVLEKKEPCGEGTSFIRSPSTTIFKNKTRKDHNGYKALLKNMKFHKILHLHGIIFGLESLFLMTLNEMLIPRFPGYEFKIGLMGSVGPVFSLLSSFSIGVLIDRTHAFKRISIATTALTSLLAGVLTLCYYLKFSFYTLFFTYIAISIVSSTYYTTAFHHCAVLTYPISEARSGVLLIWVAQLYNIIFARIASFILFRISAQVLLITTLCLYSLTFFISLILDDKRQ